MTALAWIGAGLAALGVPFFVLGTVGLLRFPDVYTRLHALAKADNVGLGMLCTGLSLYAGSLALALAFFFVWALMVIASAAGAGLIAHAARSRGVKPWGT